MASSTHVSLLTYSMPIFLLSLEETDPSLFLLEIQISKFIVILAGYKCPSLVSLTMILKRERIGMRQSTIAFVSEHFLKRVPIYPVR